MALNVAFYRSSNWNTGASGTVGGTFPGSPTGVASTLSEVFPEGVSDYIGQDPRVRFQKIFVKNEGSAISNVKVFLNDVKHPGQIQIFTGNATDIASAPSSYPTNLSASDFVEPIGLANATGLGIANPLGGTASFSLWIKQSIPSNLAAEIGASATIGIVGE